MTGGGGFWGSLDSPSLSHEMMRDGVGLVIIHPEKRLVLAGLRRGFPDATGWQLPQGGVDADETPEAAAQRELGEETGWGFTEVRLLRLLRCETEYRFDTPVLKDGQLIAGQRHRWVLMQARYDTLPNPELAPDKEFERFAWLTWDTLLAKCFALRKPAYETVSHYV